VTCTGKLCQCHLNLGVSLHDTIAKSQAQGRIIGDRSLRTVLWLVPYTHDLMRRRVKTAPGPSRSSMFQDYLQYVRDGTAQEHMSPCQLRKARIAGLNLEMIHALSRGSTLVLVFVLSSRWREQSGVVARQPV